MRKENLPFSCSSSGKNNYTELDILYFNDAHGNFANYRRLKTAADEFHKNFENKKETDTLTLSAGDLKMSINKKINVLILKILNEIGLDATATGNHDLDGGDGFAEEIDEAKIKFPFLAANLIFNGQNKPEEKFKEEKLAKSVIIKRNNGNYGLIGLAPVNLREVIYLTPQNRYLDVMDIDKSISAVKEEVKKLESKGINKIILLSHVGHASSSGEEYYKKLAQIPGIDIIVEGHDHKLFDGITENVNLIVPSAKDKSKDINPNPVIIVQAGENLNHFGILKAVFDSQGIIKYKLSENTIKEVKNYPEAQSVIDLEKKYTDNGKVIGSADKDYTYTNKFTEENPVADLTADAILSKTGAQIAFVNSGTIQGEIKKGDITLGVINQVLPNQISTLIKTKLTKKTILEVLNLGAQSTTFSKVAPGIVQVAGLKYVVTPEKTVKDVFIVNSDGSLGERIDDETVSDSKEYEVAYDTYWLSGPSGLTMLAKDVNDEGITHYPCSKAQAVIEYINKKFAHKPIKIVTGRIVMEKA